MFSSFVLFVSFVVKFTLLFCLLGLRSSRPFSPR
jgi:hypothetical protein